MKKRDLEKQRAYQRKYVPEYRKRPHVIEAMKARHGKYDEQRAQWRRDFPERCMWHNAKLRAKRRGLDFTITTQDIRDVWPPDNVCPVFGVVMERGTRYAPSLDRRCTYRGYVPGNIAVISWRANLIKSDADARELELVLDYARSCGTTDGPNSKGR